MMSASTSASAASDPLLGQLADFLRGRRDAITDQWMEAVRQSPKIESADHLEPQALADHLPKLLNHLFESLHGDPRVGQQTRYEAEEHGQHRWEQNYELDEVLFELGIVRNMVLAHGLDAFEDAHPDAPRAALREARARLLRFFENTAIGSVRQYVEKQQARLQAVDASRLQLMRTVAHELKNALGALNGAVMVLGLEGVDESERQKMFMICHRNFADMSQLLKELTDFSVLLAGASPAESRPFQPALLCDEMALSFRPLVSTRGMTFESYCHPDLREVRSDRLKIKQVLTNLVSNAIKYRQRDRADGRIRLSFLPDGQPGYWRLAVEDDGIGIAAEHLQTVFEEFRRVAPERADVQGAGLGLAITKRLVHLLGGSIKVDSELGKGSVFTVTLPLVLAA